MRTTTILRELVIAFAFLIAAGPAMAEVPEWTPLAPLAPFRTIGVPDGLPVATVSAIAQDRRGLMWIGTEEGLVRYDGLRMVVVQENSETYPGIPSATISALALDKNGKLWIGTEGGLAHLDEAASEFKTIQLGEEDDSQHVVDITVSNSGLWILTLDAIYRANGSSEAAAPARVDLAGSAPKSIGSASDDDLWVGEDGLITKVNADGEVLKTVELPLGTISSIAPAGDDLWVGGEGGIVRVKNDGSILHLTSDDGLVDDRVTKLLVDSVGTLWIGTETDLSSYSPDGVFTGYESLRTSEFTLKGSNIHALFEDSEGVIWIGTWTGGASLFDYRAAAFRRRAPDGTFGINKFDGEGNFWAGGLPGHATQVQSKRNRQRTWTEIRTSEGELFDLVPFWINEAFVDKRGDVWLGTAGAGTIRLDTETGVGHQYQNIQDDETSLPADTIFDMAQDSRGNLWMATWGGGVARYDFESDTFRSFNTRNTELPVDHIYTISIDPNEPMVLWIGTANAGLARLDIRTGTVTVPELGVDDERAQRIDTIAAADDGTLWLGSFGGGLLHFYPATNKVERWTIADGLPSNFILCLQTDRSGGVWASSSGGLIHLDQKKKLSVFTSSDGAHNDFAQQDCAKDQEGRLAFSALGAYLYFSPEDIAERTELPPLIISSLELPLVEDESRVRAALSSEKVEMAHSESLVVIHLSVPAYASPNQIRYQYRIDALSEEWIDATGGDVTLNLPSGEFGIGLRAIDAHGATSAERRFVVEVNPPWWRSIWAFIVYGLILVAAAVGFASYQQQRVRTAQQELRLNSVERDLELTGAVQRAFLPQAPLVKGNGFELYGFYRPAGVCSGDWWWHEAMPGGKHLVVVGDVTGHGPGPAMVTAAVATAFRVQSEIGSVDVPTRLKILNDEVRQVGGDLYHMTMCVFEFDENSGEYKVYSAGGPPMLRLPPEKGRARALACPGTPLGAQKLTTGLLEGALVSGERLLLYSDGIPEISLDENRLLGMRRWGRMFEETRPLDIPAASAAMVAEAEVANGTQPQEDDWTFVIIDFHGAA